jgi:hypothetical protein
VWHEVTVRGEFHAADAKVLAKWTLWNVEKKICIRPTCIYSDFVNRARVGFLRIDDILVS